MQWKDILAALHNHVLFDLHCALKSDAKSWVQEKQVILLLTFDFRNGFQALPFLFKSVFFRIAIFA